MRTVLGSALEDMVGKDRTDWVLCWPGQIVIAGSQTAWTAGVEEGIREDKLGNFLKNVMLANVGVKDQLESVGLTLTLSSWTV